MNPAAAAPATAARIAPADGPGQEGGQAEPRWLAEVRLRAARRVFWLRHLWSQPGYEDEHLLAISHSEVDRVLLPPAELADAERAFYRSDERAAAISAQLRAPAAQADGTRLGHLAATLVLTRADPALYVLAAAAAAAST